MLLNQHPERECFVVEIAFELELNAVRRWRVTFSIAEKAVYMTHQTTSKKYAYFKGAVYHISYTKHRGGPYKRFYWTSVHVSRKLKIDYSYLRTLFKATHRTCFPILPLPTHSPSDYSLSPASRPPTHPHSTRIISFRWDSRVVPPTTPHSDYSLSPGPCSTLPVTLVCSMPLLCTGNLITVSNSS